MKAIQTVSYDIKQRHPSARRNVLFDDSTMDLVLDFCLGEGGQWKRSSSKQALARKDRSRGTAASKKVDEAELDGILGHRDSTDAEDDDSFETAEDSNRV